MKLGAIEAGGTKFVAAVGNEKGEVTERVTVATTRPAETLEPIIQFFAKHEIAAIGVGAFGPIDVNPDSPTYGYVTSTPKAGWRNFDFVGTIKRRFPLPIAWTTDVNEAGYGEYRLGNARGTASCLYLTIGTGIGGGFINGGKLFSAFSHPEMGHIAVVRRANDAFIGLCPYHHDCFEGMASGPAVEARWGDKGIHLAGNPEVWELEADYVAQALVSYTLTLRPERIVIGGGLMKQKQLFPLIRKKFMNKLNNYVEVPDVQTYIQPVGLNDQAGIVGGLLLAAEAYQAQRERA
ncbi:MAG: ROK family protein [Sporolactobacillus sp.]